MGYIFLSVALLTGVTKGFFGKKTSGKISKTKEAMLANTIRMVLCIVVGFVIICAQGEAGLLKINGEVLAISLLSGITTSAFVVSWLIAVKKGAYMMVDVFLMLGTVIPIMLSAALFGEKIEMNEWVGLLILLIAVLIMCSYNNSIKEKMSLKSFLLLCLCGASSGMSDMSQKLFVKAESMASGAVFNFYTYVFSSIVLFVCCLFFFRKKEEDEERPVDKIKSVFWYIVVMSICLFLNSYFKTLAAGFIPAAQLYPLNQGLGLILSTVMSAVFFKEKMTPKCIIGILIAFTGLIFINVL